MRSCEWCSASVDRLWEIPKAANRRKQWVCKDCLEQYENGERDAHGNPIGPPKEYDDEATADDYQDRTI